MLLEPVDRQIGKYQKPVYIVRGTDSTEECILVETLMGVDIEYLNFAYTEGSGETLYDKMKSLTLPNGSNALRFFSPRIKNTQQVHVSTLRMQLARELVDAVVNLDMTALQIESE